MPLPINNSRPAIPYVPAQILPNYNRYESLGNFPPTAQQFDGDLNAIMDFINTLADAINNTAAGIFPGADILLNANRVPTTDGQGNISWTLINPLNLDINAVQTQHIQDTAITTSKIQVQAVGTNQLAPGAVTVGKMTSTGHKCLLAGRDTDSTYYELAPNNQSQPWYVFCNNPNAPAIALNSLVDIWNYTPYTFDGGKLTDGTVKGTALTNGSVAGTKLTDTSVPLSKLQASGNKCLVMGTTGSTTYTEKVANNETQPWYVFCNNPASGSIALNSLIDIWNQTPGTFSGSKITAGSLSIAQITDLQKNLPFASATVSANSSLLRGTNVSGITNLGLGLYRVNFANQPPSGSTNYNVQVSIGGEYSCSWANKTLNSVEVHIYTTAAYYNAPFDIVISDVY